MQPPRGANLTEDQADDIAPERSGAAVVPATKASSLLPNRAHDGSHRTGLPENEIDRVKDGGRDSAESDVHYEASVPESHSGKDQTAESRSSGSANCFWRPGDSGRLGNCPLARLPN